MKVLVLGASGMLGHRVFQTLCSDGHYVCWGTVRNADSKCHFPTPLAERLITGIDVLELESLSELLHEIEPDVVINCVGLIKQLEEANDPLVVLPINALFPHQLAKICAKQAIRLVHISTDCVFNGRKGMYTEQDVSNAEDLYGKSKFIGEIHEQDNVITLRTSIIGHELQGHSSLIDWFLSQEGAVKGFKKAIFSGLTTVELADVIKNYVLPNKTLFGLFHVAVEPIDKFSLLNLVADIYSKEIEIQADENVQINRSLNAEKFVRETGYSPPSWPILIKKMYETNVLEEKGIEKYV